jgi:hypothetical protein
MIHAAGIDPPTGAGDPRPPVPSIERAADPPTDEQASPEATEAGDDIEAAEAEDDIEATEAEDDIEAEYYAYMDRAVSITMDRLPGADDDILGDGGDSLRIVDLCLQRLSPEEVRFADNGANLEFARRLFNVQLDSQPRPVIRALPGFKRALYDYQMADVAKMVRSRTFPGLSGCFNTSAVGYGKTFESISVAGVIALAFLCRASVLGRPKDHLPMRKAGCRSEYRFGIQCVCVEGSVTAPLIGLPFGPSVAVVPATLVAQWHEELLDVLDDNVKIDGAVFDSSPLLWAHSFHKSVANPAPLSYSDWGNPIVQGDVVLLPPKKASRSTNTSSNDGPAGERRLIVNDRIGIAELEALTPPSAGTSHNVVLRPRTIEDHPLPQKIPPRIFLLVSHSGLTSTAWEDMTSSSCHVKYGRPRGFRISVHGCLIPCYIIFDEWNRAKGIETATIKRLLHLSQHPWSVGGPPLTVLLSGTHLDDGVMNLQGPIQLIDPVNTLAGSLHSFQSALDSWDERQATYQSKLEEAEQQLAVARAELADNYTREEPGVPLSKTAAKANGALVDRESQLVQELKDVKEHDVKYVKTLARTIQRRTISHIANTALFRKGNQDFYGVPVQHQGPRITVYRYHAQFYDDEDSLASNMFMPELRAQTRAVRDDGADDGASLTVLAKSRPFRLSLILSLIPRLWQMAPEGFLDADRSNLPARSSIAEGSTDNAVENSWVNGIECNALDILSDCLEDVQSRKQNLVIITHWPIVAIFLSWWLRTRMEGLDPRYRLALVIASSDPASRREVLRQVQDRAVPRGGEAGENFVVVTTYGVSGTGTDGFQRWCSNLVHFGSPMFNRDFEQANGRINRHGAVADDATIYHITGDEASIDFQFWQKLQRKISQRQLIEFILGGRTAGVSDADSPESPGGPGAGG